MVSRIGLVSGFFFANKGGDGMETDVEKLLPITEFKLEPAEKVNGKDAKVVSYNASPEGKTPARVTLWVDAKTLLPLKRLIVLGKGGERFSETYNEFTLNPKKIDLNFTFTAKKIVVDPALEAIVSGTVTYKGKPVPDSYIDFYPAEGQLRGGETDAAGNYTVKGLTAGAYRVVVNSSKVPALYRDRDTTSLRVTLMKGANIFNIELK